MFLAPAPVLLWPGGPQLSLVRHLMVHHVDLAVRLRFDDQGSVANIEAVAKASAASAASRGRNNGAAAASGRAALTPADTSMSTHRQAELFQAVDQGELPLNLAAVELLELTVAGAPLAAAATRADWPQETQHPHSHDQMQCVPVHHIVDISFRSSP